MACAGLIQTGALCALALIACWSAACAVPAGESDELVRQPSILQQEAVEANPTVSGIGRSDCLAGASFCQSECASRTGRDECEIDPCSPGLEPCLAILPVGKSPSLPIACIPLDREAFQRLERQGELLDADPTLFAESYRTLIRARIACKAGDAKALNLYDEILESLQEKLVPAQAAGQTRQ